MTLLIALIVILRLLNNLLKAGYFGLGQISLLSLAERYKDHTSGLVAYLDDPLALNMASQVFDKVSLLLLVAATVVALPQPDLIVFAIFLVYLIVFDLLLPNGVASFFPEPLVTRLFPILHPFYAAETPIIMVARHFSERGRMMEEEDEEEDPEDLHAFLRAGAEEGIIEEKEKSLIRNVLEFNDTVVREVMTPRTDIVAIEHSMSRDQIFATFRESNYSRLPIYRNDIDQIEGFVRLKDYIEVMEADEDIADTIKPTLFVPENKSIADLLSEMLMKRIQMVIVIDEFGGTAGLLTLEDLIEEIVGEIHDEHEAPELDEIIPQQNGAHLVDGKVLLEDFNELFGVQLEEEDIDTIGGYIFNREGHIPEVGETCEVGERTVEIVHADERRIYKLLVHPEEEKTNTPVSDA